MHRSSFRSLLSISYNERFAELLPSDLLRQEFCLTEQRRNMLLYGTNPLPGYNDTTTDDQKEPILVRRCGMWPASVVESRALLKPRVASLESVRFDRCPSPGQGQSMFGDPLHLSF